MSPKIRHPPSESGTDEYEGESLGSSLKDSQNIENKLKNLGVDRKEYENEEEFQKNMKDLSNEIASGHKGTRASPIRGPG